MKMIVTIELVHETDSKPVQEAYVARRSRFIIKDHKDHTKKKLNEIFEEVTNDMYKQWDSLDSDYISVDESRHFVNYRRS